MAELVIYSFSFDNLTIQALELLKAAVVYAKKNSPTRRHTMSTYMLRSLAGLSSVTPDEFTKVLTEVPKASLVIEAVDTDAPERDDLPWGSFPLLRVVATDDSCVTFEVEDRVLDDKLLTLLLNLRTAGQYRNRENIIDITLN